uniref:Uncharacterized protein n=1 Tax=Arundo donax TaxID=35708 RepID=A0A0A8ZDU6_ARUDO
MGAPSPTLLPSVSTPHWIPGSNRAYRDRLGTGIRAGGWR